MMLRIVVNQDATFAFIPMLNPGTTRADIEAALQRQGVRQGVCWERIDEALERCLVDNTPVEHLVVAESEGRIVRGEFLGFADATAEPVVQDALMERLTRFSRKFVARQLQNLPPAIFLHKGQFMRFPCSQSFVSLYGAEGRMRYETAPFACGDNISVSVSEDHYVYTAANHGYLGVDTRNRLCSLDPLENSEDMMSMWYWVLALEQGRSSLIKDCTAAADENSGIDSSRIEQLLAKGGSERLLIRSGIRAVDGRDGSVKVLIERIDTVTSHSDAASIRDHSPYQYVKAQTPLVEVVPATHGVPGRNCVGTIVHAKDGKGVSFAHGENVFLDKSDEKVIYRAAVDGVLHLSEKAVAVHEVLEVRGNVSGESGNIYYEKDVVIEGNVNGGYRVEGENSIYVNGSIEDGATVICKGDLFVKGGVYGEKSEVVVHGNATVASLQTTRITVKGNLLVSGYIYRSDVMCRGKVVVEGRKLYKDDIGAVVGGEISALSTLDLHSVGTTASRTSLVCGIDPHLYPKLRQARELQQPLNKRIGALQTKLGLNLRGRNIKERLANMPAAQKNTVKLLLVKLKEAIGLKEQSEKRIAALEKLAVNQDPVTTKIVIHGRIVPIIRMRILDFSHPVIDELYGREFHVVDGDIGSAPLGSAGS